MTEQITSRGERLSDLRKRAWAWCTGWPIEIIEKITSDDSQDGKETDAENTGGGTRPAHPAPSQVG